MKEKLKKVATTLQTPKKIRIWSAGCSTGEEAYSIAMCILDTIGQLTGWDVQIIATDIDTNVLQIAKQGIYKDTQTIPQPMLRQYTDALEDQRIKMRFNVQKLITFQKLNLLESWPFLEPFDIIFCRNVVIYFDKETQTHLFNRMADVLRPNGWLYIGHSESLYKICNRFRLRGRTIYQRCDE